MSTIGARGGHETSRVHRTGNVFRSVAGGAIRYAKDLYKSLVLILAMPIILGEYFEKETGGAYGIGFGKKTVLLLKTIRNTKRIPTLSHFLEHLTLATRIMKVPPSTDGCVVECGCYVGGSTANLSLVCALTGRRLEVFDSFEGLPDASDLANKVLGKRKATYSPGDYRGTLEEVKTNVSRWGDIRVCGFNVGYFDDTLPGFDAECVLAFLDVDLRSSLETCVENLWPLLRDDCYLFTHEAEEIEIAALFFDVEWRRRTFRSGPPGLAGAGSGLGLVPAKGAFISELGFTIKDGGVLHPAR